jgi:hypothetical protein
VNLVAVTRDLRIDNLQIGLVPCVAIQFEHAIAVGLVVAIGIVVDYAIEINAASERWMS